MSVSQSVRIMLGGLAAILVGLVAFTLVGALRPDALFGIGMRLIPQYGLYLVLGMIAWSIWWVIQMTALQPQRTSMPGVPSGPVSAGDLLSGNIDPGQSAMVLLPAALFGALALGAAILPAPTLNLLATDPAGHVWVNLGSHLYEADQQGALVLDIDLTREWISTGGLSNLFADDSGNAYLTDDYRRSAFVFGSDGRRVRTEDLSSLTSLQRDLSVCAKDGQIFVPSTGGLIGRSRDGSKFTAISGPLKFPSGCSIGNTGQLVVADTGNMRVLVSDGQQTHQIDSSGIADERRYPTEAHMAANGDMYVLVRKQDPALPGRTPLFWRGKLYRATSADGGASWAGLRALDWAIGPRQPDLLGFAVLPDGRLLLAPLGEDLLYACGPDGRAAPWGPGRLGELLRDANSRDLINSWGPGMFLGFALAFPLGFVGVTVSRKAKGAADGSDYVPWSDPPGM
jgi:hypothetical protein